MTHEKTTPETISDHDLERITGGAGAGSSGSVAGQTKTATTEEYGIALATRNDSLSENPPFGNAPDDQ